VDLAERLDRPLVFVVNGGHPRAKITTEAVIALSQHGPLASTVIHQRTDFAASMIDGRTVMEIRTRSRSPEEIEQLWGYISARLENRRLPGAGLTASTPKTPLETQSGIVAGRTLEA
jgi:chromosome partitioning protein